MEREREKFPANSFAVCCRLFHICHAKRGNADSLWLYTDSLDPKHQQHAEVTWWRTPQKSIPNMNSHHCHHQFCGLSSLLTHFWPILNYSPYSPMVPRSLEVHIGKRPFFLIGNITVASFNPRFFLTSPYWYWGSIFDPRDLRPGPVTRTMLRMKHVKFAGRPDKKKRRGPKGAVYLW
jgi:hypothetical protein